MKIERKIRDPNENTKITFTNFITKEMCLPNPLKSRTESQGSAERSLNTNDLWQNREEWEGRGM